MGMKLGDVLSLGNLGEKSKIIFIIYNLKIKSNASYNTST